MKLASVQFQSKRHYGWRPDKPDFRDHVDYYAAAKLPPAVDLRPNCSPVLDQGNLGSCTANAIAEAIEFDRLKQGLAAWNPSRLFIYYNERALEGTLSSDAGAEIRDGIKSTAKLGAPPEKDWPYVVSKFATKPPAKAYTAARLHKSLSYQRVEQTLPQMQGCLAGGFPFVAGFSVYESFESKAVESTGVVPMPRKSESVIGGHAVLVVGYDDPTQRFIAQNSWGTAWGQAGFFTIPYAYLANQNLASDFWQISVVQ